MSTMSVMSSMGMVIDAAAGTVLLPVWVVVSQWVLLAAFGFFLLLAYRQLGYMLRLSDIGSERDGLPVGAKAPAFAHVPINEHVSREQHFDPLSRWSLLLFGDPSCVSCQSALVALERLAPSLRGTRLLVATVSEPAVVGTVEAFASASVPISHVAREVPNKMYHTMTTPFAYVIDPEGVIRGKASVANERSLRKLAQKIDRHIVLPVLSTAP